MNVFDVALLSLLQLLLLLLLLLIVSRDSGAPEVKLFVDEQRNKASGRDNDEKEMMVANSRSVGRGGAVVGSERKRKNMIREIHFFCATSTAAGAN